MGSLAKICLIAVICIYVYPNFADSATVPKGRLSFSDRCYYGQIACQCVLRRRDPHCASNGITYRNKCEISCHNKHCPGRIHSLHRGSCDSDEPSDTNLNDVDPKSSVDDCMAKQMCICNKMMDPQCGSDNVTYNNGCQLNCAKKCKADLSVSHPGAC